MGKPGAERVCEMSGGVEEGHWQIQVLTGRRALSERLDKSKISLRMVMAHLKPCGKPVHVATTKNRWREWESLP